MGRSWGFRLEPNNNWFDSYASQHYGSPDISIITDTEDAMPNVYLWSSPHFDSFVWPIFPASGTQEEQVAASKAQDRVRLALLDRATALKIVFDGALFVIRQGHYHPMDWSGLFELPQERSQSWEYGDPSADPFDRAVIGSQPFSPQVYNNITYGADQLIYTARYDHLTLGMLRLLGRQGPTFVALHNLLDTMKTGGWNNSEVAKAAGVNPAEIARILATDNNHGALGFDARHGDLGQKAYQNAIPLAEAQNIVLGATRLFIFERAKLASQGKTKPI